MQTVLLVFRPVYFQTEFGMSKVEQNLGTSREAAAKGSLIDFEVIYL
ncbi:MAG: hypothetical protein JETT_3138 [Candidatus Jettenia ecosi]|uniref:Uncharacterized protein n=1 Tax=Candidatus Jettenia ecosi TaxID=2494326 RepID=A0A533Q7K2_9BACT|nr:MAG: hypothetical protein JETT_3138 [Candidatus Jettenia ecosi]